MQRLMWSCTSAVVFLGLVVAPVVGEAQQAPFDHLKCYKISDKQRPFLAKQYDMDLVPEQKPLFGNEHCTLKMKAKLFCIDVRKENVTPSPPGAPAGPQASDYLCYKFKGKCPTTIAKGWTVDVTDQFASGLIGIKRASMLCAPATKKTTTTSSTSTTSTSSTTTTSTTLPGDCHQLAGSTTCGGVCPPGGTCQWVALQGRCCCDPTCGSTTTTITTSTTTTTVAGPVTCNPATTQAPQCDGTCPPGQICMACGLCAASPIACCADSDCPAMSGPCIHTDPCDCFPSPGLPCGVLAGPPECYGDCPPNETCHEVSGNCQCF